MNSEQNFRDVNTNNLSTSGMKGSLGEVYLFFLFTRHWVCFCIFVQCTQSKGKQIILFSRDSVQLS